MDIKRLLTRERMFILVVGLLILILGGIYRFSATLGSVDWTGSSARGKVRLIEKYQTKAADLPWLEKRQLFLTKSLEQARGLLIRAGSHDLAGVAVQNLLKEMGEATQVTVKSVSVLKADGKGYRYVDAIPVRMVLTAPIARLQHFLYRIENCPTLLSVSELRIVRPHAIDREDLNIIVTIQGFLDRESLRGGGG